MNPGRLVALVCLLILPMVFHGWGPSARAAPLAAGSACTGASTGTNAVIHYYLALDRRQFAAAYACLAPGEQRRRPFGPWVVGFAHTVRSRLMFADSFLGNGYPIHRVAVELLAVDQMGGRRVAQIYMGQWRIDGRGQMYGGALHPYPVSGTPSFNVRAIFGHYSRVVLERRHSDVTGDRVADDIYLTSGAGCGSCHGQQVWVYSGGRLVFQQEVDDASVSVMRDHRGMTVSTDTPGTPGVDSCCPASKTIETWRWSPHGFVLTGQRMVKTH